MVNGELCSIATSKWTLINLEKGLLRLPNNLIEKYQTENKSTFESFKFTKLKEPDGGILAFEYTVQRKDIDINNHMHNLCYLDLAYEALPNDIYTNSSIDNIEIMYKTGALLGDKIKCYYYNNNGINFVTIKSEDNTKLHSIIKLY